MLAGIFGISTPSALARKNEATAIAIARIVPTHSGQERKSLQSRKMITVKTSRSSASTAETIAGVNCPSWML